MRHAYPFALEPEEDGRAVNVAFPDVPGARTFGVDGAKARTLAEDCLIAALGGYVELGKPIRGPASGSAAFPIRAMRTADVGDSPDLTERTRRASRRPHPDVPLDDETGPGLDPRGRRRHTRFD